MNINRSKVLPTTFCSIGGKKNTNDSARTETFSLVNTSLDCAFFDAKSRVREKMLVAFYCQGNWYILFTEYLSMLPLCSAPSRERTNMKYILLAILRVGSGTR